MPQGLWRDDLVGVGVGVAARLARTEHAGELPEVPKQHFVGCGIAYLWGQQLLTACAKQRRVIRGG